MDSLSNRPPKILSLDWGKVEIDGYEVPFKDVKLFPGGARKWDWAETGTEHTPGVQYSDVDELIRKGAKKIILTQGMSGALRIPPETVEKIESKGIKVQILNTEPAVKLYNELRENEYVGALIHTTC